MTQREKDFTLPDFFRLLKLRWKVVLACGILLGAFLAFAALVMEPTYEANASVQIPSATGGLGAVGDVLSLGGGGMVSSEVEIVRSRSIMDAVIDELSLNVDIRDATYGNAVSEAIMFVFGDRLRRGLRSLRVNEVEFPQTSTDKKFYVTFTDDTGGFRVRGPSGDLGTGRQGAHFTSESLSFAATAVKGRAGTRFLIIPKSHYRTVLRYRERMKASIAGGSATRSNIILVSYEANDAGLASDVAEAIVNEYVRRDTEWKSSMGQARTAPIEAQIAQTLSDLGAAESALEQYKNQYGVVSLPDEARLAVSVLSDREAEKVDLELRLSMLQDIQRQLAASINSDSFAVPPSLTQDSLIQQLATDHARLIVELQDLLLDYTESHPSVIAKREEIIGVRQNILNAISATTRSLSEQRANLEGVIGDLTGRLYDIPGVERNLVDLTRKRDVADATYRLLLQRLSEARLAASAYTVGNRIVDHAVPPDQPVSPSIKRNLEVGFGLGVVLGVFLVFLLEILDPRLRRPDQIEVFLHGSPLASIRKGADDEISRAASTLALALVRSSKPSIALICPGDGSENLRNVLENVVFEVSRGVQPLLLVQPMAYDAREVFFEADPSQGLSEIAKGLAVEPQPVEGGQVLMLPPGAKPSSACVTNNRVRDRIAELQGTVKATLFYLDRYAADPALRGWTTMTGGAVLVLRRNHELQKDILSACEALESDKVPILAALLID